MLLTTPINRRSMMHRTVHLTQRRITGAGMSKIFLTGSGMAVFEYRQTEEVRNTFARNYFLHHDENWRRCIEDVLCFLEIGNVPKRIVWRIKII